MYGTDSLSGELGLLESSETILLVVWLGLKMFKLGNLLGSYSLLRDFCLCSAGCG